MKTEYDELLEAAKRLRAAFVVAVGDKSPFAQEALRPLDQIIAEHPKAPDDDVVSIPVLQPGQFQNRVK